MQLIRWLFTIFCISYFLFSFHYFVTGEGGAALLALTVFPLALVISYLNDLLQGTFYPRLSPKIRFSLAIIFTVICVFLSLYLRSEYYNFLLYRAGAPNLTDLIIAGMVLALVLEVTFRKNKVLFGLVTALLIYNIYGWLFPPPFKFSGLDWQRVLTVTTIELKLGVFGTYLQTGVGVIAAFLMILGFCYGFGIQSSLIKIIMYFLGRKPVLIPQSAVLSSLFVGMASGSGSSNVAITGQFTIPLMKRVGFDPRFAGAVECAASMGGMIMPPVMGIAAFLMADFLQVSYFEVVVRGFAVAFLYYWYVALSVYLETRKVLSRSVVIKENLVREFTIEKPGIVDYSKAVTFFVSLILLVIFMSPIFWMEASTAAWIVATFIVVVLIVITFFIKKGPVRELIIDILVIIRRSIEEFGRVTADILILLALLGIIISLFTASGTLVKLSSFLMLLGKDNVLLLVGLVWMLGLLFGAGIPPSATFILLSALAAPWLVQAGLQHWVAYFFIFVVSIMAENVPPTSVSGAVAARIAETSYLGVIANIVRLAYVPLSLTAIGIIIYPELVLEPNLDMLKAFSFLFLISTLLVLAIQGKFFKKLLFDILLKVTFGVSSVLLILWKSGVAPIILP